MHLPKQSHPIKRDINPLGDYGKIEQISPSQVGYATAEAFIGKSAPKGCPSWTDHQERDGCNAAACTQAKNAAVNSLTGRLGAAGYAQCQAYVLARSTCNFYNC